MSGTYVFVVLLITVALLIFMVSKLKLHAIVALFLATIVLGILVKTPINKIPNTINSGFGSTCTSVALVIFLGSLLGIILNETGAIVKLTDSLVKMFGEKRVLWAIGGSCCILGIPVFPDTMFSMLMGFIGQPLSALFIGCFTAVFLQVKEWWKRQEIRNDWINQAVVDCAGPVFITALGGSLAAFIKNAGVAEILADMIVSASIPGIFIPMLIGILIRIATGSNTLAVTTAAALCQPMLETIGVSPLAAYLAMCSGAICFSHANSSGFWLTCSLSGLDFKQGLRSVGASTALSGLACCAFTLVLYFAGLI